MRFRGKRIRILYLCIYIHTPAEDSERSNSAKPARVLESGRVDFMPHEASLKTTRNPNDALLRYATAFKDARGPPCRALPVCDVLVAAELLDTTWRFS